MTTLAVGPCRIGRDHVRGAEAYPLVAPEMTVWNTSMSRAAPFVKRISSTGGARGTGLREHRRGDACSALLVDLASERVLH